MFNTLIANLPYNPSLAFKIEKYEKRLKKTIVLRSISLVVLSAFFIIQLFVVLLPNLRESSPSYQECNTTNVFLQIVDVNCTTADAIRSVEQHLFYIDPIYILIGIFIIVVISATLLFRDDQLLLEIKIARKELANEDIR